MSFLEALGKRRQKYCQNRQIRSLRKTLKGCGQNLQVFGHVEVTDRENIVLGDNCKLNDGAHLQGTAGLTVGNNCTFSKDVVVLTTGYDLAAFAEGRRVHAPSPVTLGDYTWLCTRAMVMPGVQITGHHVVVAAGSVVTHDISENYVVYGGVPARRIKTLPGAPVIES